jgi:exosortase A-associated hydrolase 1
LLLAGRPALRSGRHRLFVLLARAWAETGTPVLRFDYRGSGDSEGGMGTLEMTREDISVAIDAFQANLPGLQHVVLWGLCGGAADAILYAPSDPRVTGIVLTNPWLYDSRVRALSAIRRRGAMYLGKARRWMRSGSAGRSGPMAEMNPGEFDDGNGPDTLAPLETAAVDRAYRSYRVPDISRRLADGLQQFKGQVLVILSGNDPGAQAFKHTTQLSWRWRGLLAAKRVRSHQVPEANHSLRRPEWRERAAAYTLDWLRSAA